MKKCLILAAASFGLSLFGAASASAAGQLCYDVQVAAQGDSLVAEAGCQELP